MLETASENTNSATIQYLQASVEKLYGQWEASEVKVGNLSKQCRSLNKQRERYEQELTHILESRSEVNHFDVKASINFGNESVSVEEFMNLNEQQKFELIVRVYARVEKLSKALTKPGHTSKPAQHFTQVMRTPFLTPMASSR